MELITTWQRFAEITIKTNDLDPMYSLIRGLRDDRGEDDASRYAMAFTTFYDAGFAAKAMAETSQSTFWEFMLDNYWTAPRGTERRHFRGTNGENYLRNTTEWGPPLDLMRKWYRPNYKDMVGAIPPRCGYGAYFIWKLLDIFERCMGWPIDIDLGTAAKYMPDEPKACAATLWPEVPFVNVLDSVTDYICQFPAPPDYTAGCSYQEAETILCMIKGFFITKTHVIGDDIAEKRASLKDWPELLSYLPANVPGGMYARPQELDPQRLSAR